MLKLNNKLEYVYKQGRCESFIKLYSKNQMHVTLLLYSHNCKKVWRACFPTTESVGLTGVALANLDLLMRSLEFIEEHLEDTVAVRAARLMIEKPALSILDIAVQFGYSSHEAFTQ